MRVRAEDEERSLAVGLDHAQHAVLLAREARGADVDAILREHALGRARRVVIAERRVEARGRGAESG